MHDEQVVPPDVGLSEEELAAFGDGFPTAAELREAGAELRFPMEDNGHRNGLRMWLSATEIVLRHIKAGLRVSFEFAGSGRVFSDVDGLVILYGPESYLEIIQLVCEGKGMNCDLQHFTSGSRLAVFTAFS